MTGTINLDLSISITQHFTYPLLNILHIKMNIARNVYFNHMLFQIHSNRQYENKTHFKRMQTDCSIELIGYT